MNVVHQVIHSFCGFSREARQPYFGKPLLDGKKEYSARLLNVSLLFAMSIRVQSSSSASVRMRLPVRVASWLLDSPRIGKTHSAKRFAGHLLKQPARQGVVVAQSRLGQLLCRDCCTPRDRRFGLELDPFNGLVRCEIQIGGLRIQIQIRLLGQLIEVAAFGAVRHFARAEFFGFFERRFAP